MAGEYSVHKWSRLPQALMCMLLAVGLAGCGATIHKNGSVPGTPTIVGAKIVHGHVQVRYRVPGADGKFWPVMRITVLEPEARLPPSSHDYRPLDKEEGTVTLPFELEPSRELVVYGSVVYENGIRVHLPERHLHTPARG